MSNQDITGVDWGPGSGGVRVGMVKFGSDENLLVMFYNRSVEIPAKSIINGRPWYENQVYVKIQHPGETYNIIDRPATDQDKIRFRRHWSLFLQNRTQVPEGTPIDLLFPNYPAVAENLRAYAVYTIEQCAALSATAIETIGRGGQEYVNKAKKYIESAEKGKGFQIQEEEIRKLKQQNKLQEATIEKLKMQIDAVYQKVNDPITGSLTPPFVPNYDPQSERIAATHVSKELAEKATKKRGRPKKELEVPAVVTDPFAESSAVEVGDESV